MLTCLRGPVVLLCSRAVVLSYCRVVVLLFRYVVVLLCRYVVVRVVWLSVLVHLKKKQRKKNFLFIHLCLDR